MWSNSETPIIHLCQNSFKFIPRLENKNIVCILFFYISSDFSRLFYSASVLPFSFPCCHCKFSVAPLVPPGNVCVVFMNYCLMFIVVHDLPHHGSCRHKSSLLVSGYCQDDLLRTAFIMGLIPHLIWLGLWHLLDKVYWKSSCADYVFFVFMW